MNILEYFMARSNAMRKSFLESRTYDEAKAIAVQRIKDAERLFDFYSNKDTAKYFVERPCPFCGAKNAGGGRI